MSFEAALRERLDALEEEIKTLTDRAAFQDRFYEQLTKRLQKLETAAPPTTSSELKKTLGHDAVWALGTPEAKKALDEMLPQPTMARRNARPVRRIIEQDAPVIVCLCGSTKFGEAFADANLAETLAGRIVLTVGSMTHSDAHIQACIKCGRIEGVGVRETDFCRTAAVGGNNAHEFHPLDSKHHIGTKGKLDALHFKKIEMADEALVLNCLRCVTCGKQPDGDTRYGCVTGQHHDFQPYIGDSTRNEIRHALTMKKHLRFLNPQGHAGCTLLYGDDFTAADVEHSMRMLGLA